MLRQRIEEANRVFVEGMKQGDVAAVTALYADDATLLVPNTRKSSPVRTLSKLSGKKRWKEKWRSNLSSSLSLLTEAGLWHMKSVRMFTIIHFPRNPNPCNESVFFL